MRPEYVNIIYTIKLKKKTESIDLENAIFYFIQFEDICKKNSKAKKQLIILVFSLNPSNLQVPKGIFTNLNCIKKYITSYYIMNCHLKYLELHLCPKYSLY